MGSGVIIAGAAYTCDGNDVITQLNAVFGRPHSDKYKYAKAHNSFGGIQNVAGNWNALISAYETAGLEVNPGWRCYLECLGTVSTEGPQQGPQNIYDIAQFRYNGLINDVPMKTKTHMPHHGGHVHHGAKAGIDPGTIDSPCPMPQPPTKS
jgi:hypothetical protein